MEYRAVIFIAIARLSCLIVVMSYDYGCQQFILGLASLVDNPAVVCLV